MGHKYLEELSAYEDIELFAPEEHDKWEKQREIYGFDEREVWNLDISFLEWLYERLRMLQDFAVQVDYSIREIDYKGEITNAEILIETILEKIRHLLSKECSDWNKEDCDDVVEVGRIWAALLPRIVW